MGTWAVDAAGEDGGNPCPTLAPLLASQLLALRTRLDAYKDAIEYIGLRGVIVRTCFCALEHALSSLAIHHLTLSWFSEQILLANAARAARLAFQSFIMACTSKNMIHFLQVSFVAHSNRTPNNADKAVCRSAHHQHARLSCNQSSENLTPA